MLVGRRKKPGPGGPICHGASLWTQRLKDEGLSDCVCVCVYMLKKTKNPGQELWRVGHLNRGVQEWWCPQRNSSSLEQDPCSSLAYDGVWEASYQGPRQKGWYLEKACIPRGGMRFDLREIGGSLLKHKRNLAGRCSEAYLPISKPLNLLCTPNQVALTIYWYEIVPLHFCYLQIS